MVFSFDISNFKYECEEVQSLIKANLESDIMTERVFKDYFFESSLIYINEAYELDMNKTDKPQSNNPIVKLLRGVWNAISKLFETMKDAFTGLFKDKMTIDDYMSSNSGKEKFESDVMQINDFIDADIGKGCKLLQMISSKTGLPDQMLSEWILAGTDHIEQVVPGMIQGAIQKTVYKKVYTKLNTDQRQVQKAFEDATRLAASETDPDKKKQYEQVAAQMQKLMSAKTKLSTQLIKAAKTAGSKIKHVFTTDVNDLNQEMKEKGAQRREEKRQERAKKKAQANPEPSKASQAAKATGRFVGKSFKHVFTDQIKIGKKKEDDVTYI